MKILLVSPFFPPEVGSAAHLFADLGRALQDRGHEVTVLTGWPRYHVAGGVGPHRRGLVSNESYQGMPVYRVINLDIPWDMPILRGIDQFMFAAACGLAGLRLPRFEIALAYSPPLPLALAALGLCRLRRRPVVVNIQDLFPQSAIDLQLLQSPWLIRIFKGMEGYLCRHADRIVVHSEGNRQYLGANGGRPEKIAVLPNWVDTEAIKPGGRRGADLREELGLKGRLVVSFAGIMGYSQDLDTVLLSAGQLRDNQEIVFLLVGDGVEKPRLTKMAGELGLDNVLFLPMQPREKYPEVLAASDLCLVTLRKEVRTPVVPSKILSIMAAGKPVLAALPLAGDAPRLIREAGCGRCLPPGEPAALTEAILELSRDPDLREDMGAKGRRFAVAHLSLKAAAVRVETLLGKVMSGGEKRIYHRDAEGTEGQRK